MGLAFGIQHPGRVQSLLMHATKFYWTPEAVASTVKDFNLERMLEKVPKWAAQLQQDHAPANGDDGWKALLASAKEFIETMPDEGLTENAVNLADFPVLVSVGDSDEMIPHDEAERLAAELPNGRLNVFADTRHPMQFVQKIAFLDIALPFFQSSNGNIVSEHIKTQA